ncbi:hypothetical protein ACQCV8_13380 [Metabacillus sp. 84]
MEQSQISYACLMADKKLPAPGSLPVIAKGDVLADLFADFCEFFICLFDSW